MTINSMDKDQIIRETVTGFRARVRQHYVELLDSDLDALTYTLEDILSERVSDAAIQNRQYNPQTDAVEEI